jgi:Arc/MetJ-type ribon-helix-helix transcriptional regulator
MKKKALQRLEFDIPEQLYRQMETLVREGWFRDREEILNLALRKFLHSHGPELMAKHIREDVEWGLRGGK